MNPASFRFPNRNAIAIAKFFDRAAQTGGLAILLVAVAERAGAPTGRQPFWPQGCKKDKGTSGTGDTNDPRTFESPRLSAIVSLASWFKWAAPFKARPRTARAREPTETNDCGCS
jgi:hypothetical protein